MLTRPLISLLSGILVVIFVLCQAAVAQDRPFDDRRDGWWDRDWDGGRRNLYRELQGIWYVNGRPDKRAQIIRRGNKLQAINEFGDRSRIVVERGGVRALNWENGLRGDLRRNRIEWANGTTWNRFPSRRHSRR